MQRRLFPGISLLLLALSATGLSSCGGGGGDDSSGNASVRFVNVATGYDSLDVYKTSDTKLASAVAADKASDYAAVAAGTYTMQLKRTGSAATSSTTARTVYQDTTYTLLAFTSQDSLQTLLLNDGEAAPTSGTTKFRVINLSPEAGSLDVYVTPAGTDINNGVSPVVPAIGGKVVGPYTEITKGTYQIQVTGTGAKTDLRLHIPSVVLEDGQILSLILTSTPGGVLVHGNTLLQKGAVTANKNTTTRVRLVSGVFPAASVAANLNGTPLATDLTSPAVGAKYVLVNSGTAIPDVAVNGATATASSVTLVPGGDATLAVLGAASAAQVVLLNEDNSPPLVSSNARIRLVHGVQGLESTKLTLTINLGVIDEEVAFGTASQSTDVAAPTSTNYLVKVTGGGTTLFSQTAPNVPILAGQTYTLFMLGSAANPVGEIRKDR